MGRSDEGDTFFTIVLMMFIVSILLTIIGGVWLHWLVFGAAVLVSGWACQTMSSPKRGNRKKRR